MNQSEQIARLTRIVSRMNTGSLVPAARALAYQLPADVGLVAKRSGCTPDQVLLWASGRWEPPTDQTIALVEATQDLAAERLTLVPEPALNGHAK